jgi:hypothetical protein
MDHSKGMETSSARCIAGIAIALNVGNSRISRAVGKLMESQIKKSLHALLAAIKAADGQTIADEMAHLDDYLERGRPGLHPQLIHFLENRSYAKALMFLGGESDIPVGVCGGRAGRATNA